MQNLVLLVLLVGPIAAQQTTGIFRRCDDGHNGGCDQICTQPTTGGSAVCSCRDGYVLDPDGYSCDDINECATNNGGCQQICINTQDSGNNTDSNACACWPGWELMADGTSCQQIVATSTGTGGGVTVWLTETLYTDQACSDEYASPLSVPYQNDLCYALQNPASHFVRYHFGTDTLEATVSDHDDCSGGDVRFRCDRNVCCNVSTLLGGSADAPFAQFTWVLPATTSTSTTTGAPRGRNDKVAEQVAGGVVGGVLGLFVLILAGLLIYRWHRRRSAGYTAVASPLLRSSSAYL